MANEKTIEIVIRAKNLSDAELAKARQSVAGFKRETEGASGAASGLGGALRSVNGLLGAFGVGLSVGAVASFGKALLNDADALVKLADKTGMSTEAVQRLKYVAEQSGNTLEQMTGAVSMLQKRLGDGDDSAIGALNGLGIAVDGFMKMSPDQQFRAIAVEVGKIEDPVRRVHVATELFGKAGAELLPSLIANFDDLANSAAVMSARTVESLDRVGDKLDEVAGQAKSTASEVAVVVIDVFSELPAFLAGAMQGGIGQGMVMANAEALGKDFAERSVKGIKDGFGVLATDGPTSSFNMFSDRNVASMKRTSTAAEVEAKRMAEAHARAAEDATRAWLDAWDEMTRSGREAVANQAASFTTIGGILAQVLPGAGASPLPRAQLMIQGVRDTMAQAFTGLAPDVVGNMTVDFTPLGANLGKALRVGLMDTIQDFPALLQSALTGGGGLTGAITAVGSNLGAILGEGLFAKLGNAMTGTLGKLGAKVGGAIFDMIPGIGGMIGSLAMPLITKGLGAIKSLFTGGEGAKVNDLRDAFVGAAGGIDALNRKAQAAGTTLDQLLKAKTVKDYEAAIGSLNGKLAATAAMQGQLAGLQQQLADRQVMNLGAAEEIAAKYGGTLGNLGQQFEAAKAQASFKTVFDDYERLIDMGGDVGGSLFIMKEEIGALVGESKRIGTEIPEQFKPLIEELIRTGQLFDENGEKIDDISTLKFGAPLKSEADTIKDAILELVKALKEQLLPTIERIPRTINVHTGYTYDAYEPPNGGSGGGSENGRGGGDYSSYPGYATGALITREHVARVGEGGVPELIGPVGFMTEALSGAIAAIGAGAGASRIVIENHLHVIARGGRELAELVVPELPDVLGRYGIKVR